MISLPQTLQTPGPQVLTELKEIFGFELNAQRNHTPEPIQEIFMFRDPVDLEQLYEMPECREAAQIDSEHEFEFEANAPIDSGHESEFETIAQIESEPELEFEAIAQKESGRELEFEAIAQTDSEPHLKKRDSLKGVFRDYVRNKQRVVILEKQLRDYSDADLFLPVSIFRPHKGPAGALAELNGLKVLMAEQRNNILSFSESWVV